MNYKIRLFVFCSTLSFSTLIHATVGGAEKIKLLGYDKIDHKIYFTRNYYDESTHPPTLYYFPLNTKNSHSPIEVKSIYKNMNNDDNFIKTSKIEKKFQNTKTPHSTQTLNTNQSKYSYPKKP